MGTITEDTTTTASDERLVAEPPTTVMFMSRRSELRLTKTPRYPIRGASGQQTGESVGETVNFRDGRCDVDPNGEFELEDGRKIPGADVIEWLRNHKRHGDVNEGFWIVDHTAPAPTSIELSQLVEAATELDAEKLEALIAQEAAGWNREAILSVARGALERVRAIRSSATEANDAAQPTPPPDPIEQARAEQAQEPDWEVIGKQFGLTPDEARERFNGQG